MEASRSIETSVPYRKTTQRHNSEDFDLDLHSCENLRSYVLILSLFHMTVKSNVSEDR
jgi:hypothetical protein